MDVEHMEEGEHTDAMEEEQDHAFQAALEEKCVFQEAQLDLLKGEVGLLKGKVDRCQEEVEHWRGHAARAEEAEGRLHEEKDKLRALEEREGALLLEKGALEGKMQRLEKRLGEAEGGKAAQEGVVANLEGVVAVLQGDKAALMDDVRWLKGELRKAKDQDQVGALKEAMHRVQKQLEEARGHVRILEGTVQRLQGEMKGREGHVRVLEGKLLAAERCLEREREKGAAGESGLRLINEELRSNVEDLTRQLEAKERGRVEALGRCEGLEQELRVARSTIMREAQNARRLQVQLESTQGQLNVYMAKMKELDGLRAEVPSLEGELQRQREEGARWSGQASRALESAKAAEKRAEGLERELSKVRKQAGELEGRVGELQAEREAGRAQVGGGQARDAEEAEGQGKEAEGKGKERTGGGFALSRFFPEGDTWDSASGAFPSRSVIAGDLLRRLFKGPLLDFLCSGPEAEADDLRPVCQASKVLITTAEALCAELRDAARANVLAAVGAKGDKLDPLTHFYVDERLRLAWESVFLVSGDQEHERRFRQEVLPRFERALREEGLGAFAQAGALAGAGIDVVRVVAACFLSGPRLELEVEAVGRVEAFDSAKHRLWEGGVARQVTVVFPGLKGIQKAQSLCIEC
jgi:predicted  nucleic acid-binding Zn-ribbon protein